MNLDKSIISKWEKSLSEDDSATFYNSPIWYILQKEYFKVNLVVEKVKIADSRFLVPLLKRKNKRIFNLYSSSILGTYGTVLSLTDQKNYDQYEVIKKLSKNKNLEYSGNPFAISTDDIKGSDFTQILNLDQFELQNIKGNHRREIHKSRENGLSARFTEDKDLWQKYYELYKKITSERGAKASNSYHKKLFEIIYNIPTNFRQLWMVEYQGDLIGGGIFFRYRNKIHHWHGVAERSKIKLGTTYFLHHEVIAYARKNGLEYYDFNPSGGHEGVVKFKSGFNPDVLKFDSYSTTTNIYNLCSRMYSLLKT